MEYCCHTKEEGEIMEVRVGFLNAVKLGKLLLNLSPKFMIILTSFGLRNRRPGVHAAAAAHRFPAVIPSANGGGPR